MSFIQSADGFLVTFKGSYCSKEKQGRDVLQGAECTDPSSCKALMHTNVLAREMALEVWLADVKATRYKK